tara:strand:+ start:6371 stop:6556 length:186 start_codon:yes stop_codon:yes gene_type:complete
MEVSDLPTLFQICVAQESNADHIESLHTLFQKHQIEIDNMKEVINAQQDVINEIVKQYLKK